MKIFYRWLSALLLLGAPAYAQTTDSLRQAVDHIFAPLDKTQVPVPYLAEYGTRLASLTPFNGTLTDSSVATLTMWRMLYASLGSSNVGRPSPLPLLPDLNTALAAQVAAAPAAIPLLVQCLPYATLRPDARTAGLLVARNGQLYDVPNRPASPYLLRTLFAAVPATPIARTGAVSFVFAPGLHVHAGGTGTGRVRALSLDFGDGRGFQTAAWNVPLSAAYCSAGTKRVKVRLTYALSDATAVGSSDGESLPPAVPTVTYDSWFDLTVQTANCVANRYDQKDVLELVHTFDPVPGVHSGGKAYVRFGGDRVAGTRTPGDRTIRRPLIVAEGYDGFYAAPSVYKFNYDVEDFSNSLKGGGIYSQLENAAGNVAGYDIVFLDYTNGTDDIRRNAALFKEVVRWVNSQKVGGTATGEQNVVLGISMGGLVARYALADMAKNPNVVNGVNQNDPHTRLLVTHDSPHQGANTPLGIQMLTRQAAATVAAQYVRVFNNALNAISNPVFYSALAVFPELQQADDLLDAPATQQLLVVRALRNGTGPLAQFGAAYNSFLATDYRNMISLPAGQSFPYRFVATSLGSECGRELLAPYSELVRVERRGYLGVIGLTTGYRTEIIVNAMPVAGRVERLSSLRIWNETHVLGVSTGRLYLTNFVYHSPSSNPTAWDGLPGGTQPVRANLDVQQGSSYFDRLELVFVWGSASNTRLADEFSFVPRYSALDVLSKDASSLVGVYTNNATNGSASRATAVVAQAAFPTSSGTKYNYPHPFFPGRQAQWIFNEMQRPYNGNSNPAGCVSSGCLAPADITFSGPGTICTNATYTTPDRGPGYTYAWSATPPSLFTSPIGTGTTFTTSNNGTGSGTITLQIMGDCPRTLSRPVVVGTPDAPALEEVPGCTYNQVYYRIANHDPYLTYTITNRVNATGPAASAAFWVKGGGGSGSFTLTVSAAGCSATSVDYNVVYADCTPAARSYTLSPNPGTDEVLVEEAPAAGPAAAASSSTPAPAGISGVRVYDSYGRLRLDQPGRGAAALRLRVSALPAGLYVVHILSSGSVASRQRLEVTR